MGTSRHRRGVRRVGSVLVVLAVSVWAGVLAAAPQNGGWDYLIDRLVADGVSRARAVGVFQRVEPFDGLSFSLNPRESSARYRNFLGASSIAQARRCRRNYAEFFEAAERLYGVRASVVAAIIHVESGCGRNTGSSVILHRLARLAMANEPANLADNVARTAEGDPYLAERVRARAQYLEDTFYPEVLATFRLADAMGVDPLDLRGSGSGAFGNAQFLPSNFFKFGSDGDGDGRVDLYHTPDAAHSCAAYLRSFGWKPGMSNAEARAVIWHYNRSDAYVDTVLALALRIDGVDEVEAAPAPRAKVKTPAKSKKRVAATKKKPRTTPKKTVAKRRT